MTHPRLHPRAFSTAKGALRIVDQQVSYRTHRRHHYHWAEEPAWYLPAPTTLSHPMQVPNRAMLHFGLALLPQPHGNPKHARFTLWVQPTGKPAQKLLTTNLHATYPWNIAKTKRAHQPQSKRLQLFRRYKISLAPWQGKRVLLRWTTESLPGTYEEKACTKAQQKNLGKQRWVRRCKRSRQHRKKQNHDVLVAFPRVTFHPKAAPKPNVLLILVDTLRARALGVYGKKLNTSPQIDAFARQSIQYAKAYAVANRTRASVSAMLTSESPEAMGLPVAMWTVRKQIRTRFYQLQPPLLTRVLARRGYAVGFVGNNYFNFNMYTRGLNFGFDDKEDFWRDRDTALITKHSQQWLKRHRKQRFFLMTHYNAPHYPYPHPASFKNKIKNIQQVRSSLHRRYLAAVRYTDHHVGKLLATLDSLKLTRNTLVVFVADHGEVFEHHHNKRPPVKSRSMYNHGNTLHESELHVPLLLRLPGKLKPARIKAPVSLLDLAPTILQILGIPLPPKYHGAPLPTVPTNTQLKPIFAEANGMRSLRDGDWKYIARFGKYRKIRQTDGTYKVVKGELYNLRIDPGERFDQSQKKPKLAQRMRQRIYKYIRENRARRAKWWIEPMVPRPVKLRKKRKPQKRPKKQR